MDITELEQELFSLSVEERASIAHRLLISLEEISEPEFDQLWGKESARRAAEFDAGTVPAVTAEEVARKARALLR